jgi:hypothetical protein
MATNHAAVAALPIVGAASKTLLRNAITARMPYVLADADVVTDLVAVDPSTGAAIVDIIYLGRLFHYDATDTTTANDGISCLVTFDSRRYKLSDGSDVFAYSVLSNSIATPPASPTIGDAYLIASGATGAWAGKANYIGTYTRRGWEFILFGIGRFIYVESVDTYYHRNSGGSWVSGFGNQTFGANSVPLSAAINFGRRLIVENQTTNAPPGSPSMGDAYIIGPSPTGSWAGHTLNIAVCEDGSTFTIYTPTNGWSAFDKNSNAEFRFSGSAWISSAGAILDYWETSIALSGSTTTPGSGAYTYDPATAPTIGLQHLEDGVPLVFTARRTGQRLVFQYSASLLGTANVANTAALFVDAVSAAISWQSIAFNGNGQWGGTITFRIDASDALSHSYKVGFFIPSGSPPTTLTRRRLTCEGGS